MGAFFGENVFKNRTFCLLAPPNQMSFLTIINKNIGTRLSAIITPNSGLEQALLTHFLDLSEYTWPVAFEYIYLVKGSFEHVFI